jgi:hypothetical protein
VQLAPYVLASTDRVSVNQPSHCSSRASRYNRRNSNSREEILRNPPSCSEDSVGSPQPVVFEKVVRRHFELGVRARTDVHTQMSRERHLAMPSVSPRKKLDSFRTVLETPHDTPPTSPIVTSTVILHTWSSRSRSSSSSSSHHGAESYPGNHVFLFSPVKSWQNVPL